MTRRVVGHMSRRRGASAVGGGGDPGGGGGGVPNPLTLLPEFSRDWISYFGAPYVEQTRPTITSTSVATSEAQLLAALAVPGRHVTVPTGTTIGAIERPNGVNWSDVMITIENGASIAAIQLDRFSGVLGTCVRFMVRGPGKLGYIAANQNQSQDVIVDGARMDGTVAPAGYSSSFDFSGGTSRVGVYNCVIKAPINVSNGDGFCVLYRGDDVMFANCNMLPSMSATGANDWCIRKAGGSRSVYYKLQAQARTKLTIRQGSSFLRDVYMRSSTIIHLYQMSCWMDVTDTLNTGGIQGDLNTFVQDDRDSPGATMQFGGYDVSQSASWDLRGSKHIQRAALNMAAKLASRENAQWHYTTGVTYQNVADAAALDAAIPAWPTIMGPTIAVVGAVAPITVVIGSNPALL